MATIVLCGGGTAGHVTPNLSLIKELKKKFDKIIYIGSGIDLEKELVKPYGIEYYAINCVKFIRKFTFKNLYIPFKLLKSIKEAKELLESLKPDVIFSKGGYVALPVVKAGYKLKIPIVIHESDLKLGLTNKLCLKNADYVCTSFFETAQLVKNKGVFTGPPIQEKFLQITNNIKIFNNNNKTLLVLGGSQGSQFFNKLISENVESLTETYNIILLSGKKNEVKISNPNVIVYQFSDDLPNLINSCSVVLTRGGSNSLFEISVLKKPMLVVPLPKSQSRGDQIDNAEIFKNKKLATICEQKSLNGNNLIKLMDETIINYKPKAVILAGNKKIIETILKAFKRTETLK